MAQLREIGLWDEEYLKTLPLGEFDWLDFKASRWLEGQWLDEASEYLSTFANFDGGYLIIGVEDPATMGKVKPDGGIRRSIKNGIKEWMEDKLLNLVESRLDRIAIQDIGGSGSHSEIKPDCCVLVVYVPPSAGAPHQARNHKYYTRLGSKLNPLGHRAVMDIVNRARHPVIETTLSYVMGTTKHHLCWRVENRSTVMARFVSTEVRFPVIIGQSFVKMQHVGKLIEKDGSFWWSVIFHNDVGRPLFPEGVQDKLLEFDLDFRNFPAIIAANPSQHPRDVSFTTYADNMRAVSHTLPMEKIASSAPSL